jgi:hypothetical protein
LTKYGLIRYSGSGAKDLLSYLDNFDIAPASRKTNPLETAIGTILPIANFMNGMEVVNPINLFQQYGGGYEIASFINKKFKKIDDITYLLWFGKQNKDLSWGLSIPKVVIKYYYIDDLLIIRRFETSNKKNKLSSIMKEEIYAISPIYNQINLTNLKKIELQSFNSRFICSCIFLEDINGNPQVLSRINYSNQETNPIKFIENDNSKIEMHFKSDFVTSIFESIPKL